MKQKCPICRDNDAIEDPYYGFLPCLPCTEKQRKLKRPNRNVELVPDRIKEDRRAYFDDYHPPHRKGQLSKEWVNRWGADKAKKRGFSDKEIKNAKNVWNDDRFYKE